MEPRIIISSGTTHPSTKKTDELIQVPSCHGEARSPQHHAPGRGCDKEGTWLGLTHSPCVNLKFTRQAALLNFKGIEREDEIISQVNMSDLN